MKKIMFNDRYRLTEAVLEGKKTMTRRLVPIVGSVDDVYLGIDDKGMEMITFNELSFEGLVTRYIYPQYQVGEVVAIAQNYKDAGWNADILQEAYVKKPTLFPDLDECRKMSGIIDLPLKYHKGWTNKMFVLADLMPHHIKITDINVERLQDISDEDVYKEGFRHEFVNNNWGNSAYHEEAIIIYYDKKGLTKQIRSREPKEAFSFLIDKISGYGTWEQNSWVFVYEFELID